MSGPVTKAVIETGIIEPDALAQLQRWGLPIDVDLQGGPAVVGTEAAEKILEAVASEEAVEIRATDLDVIKQYLTQRQKGKLFVPDINSKVVGIPVEYCRTKLGEYVIPWSSEAINDALLDERTYLKIVGQPRVYFSDVRELFYGDHKAFIVCEPTKDTEDGSQ